MDKIEYSLIEYLSSGDPGKVESALTMLSTEKERSFAEEVQRAALPYLNHEDEFLRWKAIFALGTHLHSKVAFDELLRIASDQMREVDERDMAARALAGYRHFGEDYLRRALLALIPLFQDETVDPELRAGAYLAARRATGAISANDYARAPDDINDIDIDEVWLSECCRKFGVRRDETPAVVD